MKTAYRFILAAFAAVTLVSCTKEISTGREDVNPQDGLRTIAVSFAAPTKSSWTSIGTGIQPKFDDGDLIKVSNGSNSEETAIQIDAQGNAFFTTKLTGELKAVYPSTAAALNGNSITGVTVPAIQTGRFADANICMAEIAANATSATFHNKTAILRFYVDKSIDVRSLLLVSHNYPISTESISPATKEQKTNLEGHQIYVLSEVPENIQEVSKDLTVLKPLWQSTDDPQQRICYVAVLPISGDDIKFFGMSLAQEKQQAAKIYSNVTLKEGDIANAFIPYYINVRVGGTNEEPVFQRWSYCNLGAFFPEEAGYYYSWANRDGHWKNGISDGYLFTEEVYIKTNGGSIEHDITYRDDAAYAAWANKQEGTWRMPSKAEFETLLDKANPSVTDEGLVFAEGLKFPFVGMISGETLVTEIEGYKTLGYWSSSLNNGETSSAYYLVAASKPAFAVQSIGREFGLPIRPIYGESAPEGVGLTMPSFGDGEML